MDHFYNIGCSISRSQVVLTCTNVAGMGCDIGDLDFSVCLGENTKMY